MINRKELMNRHGPILKKIDTDSPLTVGNGEFAFTADVTGMQSLYQQYLDDYMPLCTMAQWGWHTEPAADGRHYSLADVKMTEYVYEDRILRLPVEKYEGNETVYEWLRHNPHRANLARISLLANGREIAPAALSDIHQELNLYEGRLISSFKIDGKKCVVTTLCHGSSDVLGFHIATDHENLRVSLSFPYPSHEMSGSNWAKNECHETKISYASESFDTYKLIRKMDDFEYHVNLHSDQKLIFEQVANHQIDFLATKNWSFTVAFAKEPHAKIYSYEKVLESSRDHWKNFWHKVGVVDFSGSKDSRAKELERRIILSTYLLAIQSSGSLPPQETGLTCNSWHGKFHLEMHLWHGAWLPLWNQEDLLETSIPWYHEILDKAIYNARKNGFKGARWPKQVAYDGIDSPSPIAPLLIWQQSHLIYMLELIRKKGRCCAWMKKQWVLVKESADFMCDYLSENEDTGLFDLVAPIIPAQEEHDPRVVKNPTFELEYWRFSLQIAIIWAEILGESCGSWVAVVEKMAEVSEKDGLYLAHENCPGTYEFFNRDHPSMLGAFGLIPNDRLNEQFLENTVAKVLECWQFETMWGWDFALMAMTATRLGKPELAMDILLLDTAKNEYVISGNNYQRLREDLPLYLPGNGSLLLAISLMVAGWSGCDSDLPGIPQNDKWQVKFEGISQFPY